MAKIYQNGKWKKRTITVLSLALASSLSLGILGACANDEKDPDDDDTGVSAIDTQLIKNGNFEFYGEKDKELKDKKAFINSPENWSFSSGSPSSKAKSGIVDASKDSWQDLALTGGYAFTAGKYGSNSEYKDKEVKTFSSIEEAIAHWNDSNVSTYDRLFFREVYKNEIEKLPDGDQKTFFKEHSYSISYNDVKNLNSVSSDGLKLHDGVKDGESNVLMIHNEVTSSDVVGTAQSYSSSTTITLKAGTAAEVSVWARTDALRAYYESDNVIPKGKVGAYVSVVNTVGGTTLDDMQIKNINTNGEWEQYTVYVRASTFATTTFRLNLGLGQGNSTNRHEQVNGFAFFDDLKCTLISSSEYEAAVGTYEAPLNGAKICTIDSDKEGKTFRQDEIKANLYGLDLYAGFKAADDFSSDISIDLSVEKDGKKEYTSESEAGVAKHEKDYAKYVTLNQIKADSASNEFLKSVYENDLKDKYPFEGNDVLMLLSYGNAAYTAKTKDFTMKPDERMLVSFFVKTSEIPGGFSGASAAIVENDTKTAIEAFDSTKLDPIDIDSKVTDKKDIYKGWAQCFFFIENTDEAEHTYHIEFSYGPTTLKGTKATDYCDGYAAFTNFEVKPLSKTEMKYASTGSQAVTVTFAASSKTENTPFAEIANTAQGDIEKGLARPADSSFLGVLGGSSVIVPPQKDQGIIKNEKPEKIYAGLINKDYAETYVNSNAEWTKILKASHNAEEWWNNTFGNARQPLVIANGEEGAYGYLSGNLSVSSSSYRKISVNVKVSNGAKAYVYLTDVSSAEKNGNLITPIAPKLTYWYDDNGNVCAKDPASEGFNKATDVLYVLQENGLYEKKGATDGKYYANLSAYEKDEHNNLVTANKVIAFYEKDGKYYASYDEEKKTYGVEVNQLPTKEGETSILRYDYSEMDWTKYGTKIVVDNTDDENGDWVTVSFFVATGDEAKSYRVEVWSGNREGTQKNPADSYVIFDNYINDDVSGDYSKLLDESVSALKDKLGVSEEDKLSNELALYYAFTYYDSDSYLRYDVNADKDELGDPYGSYKQSAYSEKLVYLLVNDMKGELLNAGSNVSMFIDYTASDVTVPADDLGSSDDATDDEEKTTSDVNVWMIITSASLSIVLLLVIVLLVVRRMKTKMDRKARVKAPKNQDNRYRPEKQNDDE